jgi:hypothetical protein
MWGSALLSAASRFEDLLADATFVVIVAISVSKALSAALSSSWRAVGRLCSAFCDRTAPPAPSCTVPRWPRVALDCYDRAPFEFNETIKTVNMRHTSWRVLGIAHTS